ncbi:multiheme C-type cytochrome [Thermodesulfatator indicus DSM 15286]|uniref:Multiheme C-type cytochrome n=1 Tax=Thermodesulfatator indicus (strain DSM 15286 / JCM 11887 / CIR29812) TaxID=667014 RepID=F8AE27_THEID|nr:cytochrome c3 family protein [Thermodesulfatator indicus]AEH46073.1 multiheme C-type cytochrome [Thermodesulfatator indicus DSM 15286]
MRLRLFLLSVFLAGGIVVACAPKGQAPVEGGVPVKQVSGHPPLTEQEKLMPCASCHKEETPDIYDEWFNSVHGLDNVKCYQCHGTFENFEVRPEPARCMPCHAKQVQTAPKDKSCTQCHPAHKFSVHK